MPAPYATADELASAVRVQVTDKNRALLESCASAASEEIDHQLDRPDDEPLPDPPPGLVHMVCLARGVEWWKANDAAFGALGFDNTGVLRAPKDGFDRYANDLIPYQIRFGLA
jgi:hypothetical protein